MRLQDKVTLITGAGGGMGRVAAQLFAGEGARVVVAEFDRAAGEETVRDATRRPAQHEPGGVDHRGALRPRRARVRQGAAPPSRPDGP